MNLSITMKYVCMYVGMYEVIGMNLSITMKYVCMYVCMYV